LIVSEDHHEIGKFAVSVFVNRNREDTATQHSRHGSRNYR
jgi:hypothetical protein